MEKHENVISDKNVQKRRGTIRKIRIMWTETRFESSVNFIKGNNKMKFYDPWSHLLPGYKCETKKSKSRKWTIY